MNPTNDYSELYQDPARKPPKQHSGCIIALIVMLVLTVILAVLAAILVPAMIGYVRKSRTANANNAARQCHRAAQSALVDLDEAGTLKKGSYIITNIPGESDYNAPYNTAHLHHMFDIYFTEDERYDYFFVVEGTTVAYAAVHDTDHWDYIGVYPHQTDAHERKVTAYDGTELIISGNERNTGENPFKDLFRNAKDTLKTLPDDEENENED